MVAPSLHVLSAILLAVCSSSRANPRFDALQIAAPGSEVMICDLDGDGLKDLILKDGLNLSIFYQDSTHGFTREPQQTCHLEGRPCVVWTAKLPGPAAGLFVMTSEGVNELCFTNRAGPPAVRQIIRQPTIVPSTAEETNAICCPLSAETGNGPPLLFVPTAEGVQVWQHRGDQWRQAQCIGNVIETHVRPTVYNPGYTTLLGLDLSVGDVNGDGRDDLVVCREAGNRTNIYSVYLQQTNGLFDPEPALSYADKAEPNSWLCWMDLNCDGKVDLIKSVWLDEPSFLPGIPSGKVLVSTYFGDEHGRIPARPKQVFRKSDFMAAVPVVDVDADGYPDLVLGYSQMDTREGLRKEITARQLDYSLRLYFQRAGAGFPTEADSQRDVVIHLNEASLLLGLSPRDYFERYVSLAGDFNGDGKRDLLVRDHGDTISVYFFISRQKAFSSEPDLRFRCPEPFDEWKVTDLNNDGVSDLIVKLQNQDSWRIFISRK